MNLESFLSHHQLTSNPFDAEEARHDAVFAQLIGGGSTHPDLPKILGRLDRPSTSVVFGEKGSGKTAIRLTIGHQVRKLNAGKTADRTLLVPYDDLNPVLDRIERHVKTFGRRRRKQVPTDELLKTVRLEDHQDAILSLACTAVVDALLENDSGTVDPITFDDKPVKVARRLPYRQRLDLAALAAIYDQPRGGDPVVRFDQLMQRLRLGGWLATAQGDFARLASIGLAAGALVLALMQGVTQVTAGTAPGWMLPVAAVALGGSLVCGAMWLYETLRRRRLAHRITRELRCVERSSNELARMLGRLPRGELSHQPWPLSGLGPTESRYQFTQRLMRILRELGYSGVLVLVDRMDEPTLVTGEPQRMKSVVWPMLDNKFLQQEGIGIKLLLPGELRPLLLRETAEFFQEARLDKQHFIERLSWSGATLYDMCTARLRACRAVSEPLGLTDLFEPEVTREMLVDALDQMRQPRDAFKFMYQVLQEHCRILPEDEARFRIPRLVLETVRRTQSQRVQELSRGLTPA